jgi:KUP system potassium uptake protein
VYPQEETLRTPKSNLEYTLALAALGVVFGDIGTSPLYALRESLHGLQATTTNVYGVLSLIFWSLIVIISIKYTILIFKADNHGEGGTLALLALLQHKNKNSNKLYYLCAIFGAGLLLGDGMLTPAISVTSAIEGLHIASPKFDNFVLPIACLLLIGLFLIQRRGTARIGAAFGPLIFLWFIAISYTGILQIIEHPSVFEAINPWYAYAFFKENGFHGYILLGGVFLAVTGGEALYADLGHFGKNPIRRSWFFIALPALIMNYFGQGAYLINNPGALANPFFMMAPSWFFIPLLLIATIATIIASQAIITATFSLTKQAVLLGLYPTISIIHTSKEHYGQIYIPQMNFFLLIGTLCLVLIFKNSSGLANAYGIAVNLTMLMVITLVACAALKIWKWSLTRVIIIFSFFISIDLLFLGANLHKSLTGGWIPIVFALIIAFLMHTWKIGMDYLKKTYYIKEQELATYLEESHYLERIHIPNSTAIFVTDIYDQSGSNFLRLLKMDVMLPEYILIVNYTIENRPYVSYKYRFEIIEINQKITKLILHFGFMDIISIPQAIYVANDRGLLPFPVDIEKTPYLIDISNIIATKERKSLWFYWHEQLFAFLTRNYSAHLNIEFYQLPYEKTIGVGTYRVI